VSATEKKEKENEKEEEEEVEVEDKIEGKVKKKIEQEKLEVMSETRMILIADRGTHKDDRLRLQWSKRVFVWS